MRNILFFAMLFLAYSCQKEDFYLFEIQTTSTKMTVQAKQCPHLWITNKWGTSVDIGWLTVPDAAHYLLTVERVGIPSQKRNFDIDGKVDKKHVSRLTPNKEYKVTLKILSPEEEVIGILQDQFNSGPNGFLKVFEKDPPSQ